MAKARGHRPYQEPDAVEQVRRVPRADPAGDAPTPAREAERPAPARRPREREDVLPIDVPAAPAVEESGPASARVAGIIAAAERSAREIRAQAEQRADERIAEGDRAAALRVQAAEEEAAEIAAEAERAAQAAAERARAEVRDVHAAAEADRAAAAAEREAAAARALQAAAAAAEEAERLLAEARAQADEVRTTARAQAREIVGEAQAAAREALRDGEQLSGDLRDLSRSLHTNAERLMRDVRLAHAQLTAGLDQAAAATGADRPPRRSRRGTAAPAPTADDDVPEFLPDR